MRHVIARTTVRAALALSLIPIALTGCDQIDPMTRPYYWHPSEVNPLNIAAMAANPDDLRHGQHSDRRRTVQDSDAVDRIWTGKPTPLLTEEPGTQGGSGGTGAATGTASGGGGGTGGSTGGGT